MKRQFRAGTRRSPLARTQTSLVLQQLKSAYPQLDFPVLPISTLGDQTKGQLPTSNPGVFTSTLENALLSGQIDFAVHSLKDLPINHPKELTIAAIPPRSSAFDILFTSSGKTLEEIPEGMQIGTSSLRRKAQLLRIRPDLTIAPLRGNVDTRTQKVLRGELTAVILAEAGMLRLGIPHKHFRQIPMDLMLPAPAQGALAVECRKEDTITLNILKSIDCSSTRRTTTAERAFLGAAGGGCSIPIGAYAEQIENEIYLRAEVLSNDGCHHISVAGTGSNALDLGHQLAERANQMGAKEVLNRA